MVLKAVAKLDAGRCFPKCQRTPPEWDLHFWITKYTEGRMKDEG
jgi:hypothetical protein